MRRRTMELVVLLALGGLICSCGGEEESVPPSNGVRVTANNPHPTACPEYLIRCPPGRHVLTLPNCRQLCIPDAASYSWECITTADCPAIYCFTTPCPQLVCSGHKCVMKANGGAPDKPLGDPCGDHVCAAGEFCCNYSCGICAPVGGFCTQQVCEPIKLP